MATAPWVLGACETEQSRASDRRARAEVPRPSSSGRRPRSGSMAMLTDRVIRNGTTYQIRILSKRERESSLFCAGILNAQTPLSVAGRAPHARLPPAEHPPIRPSRTSPATKNPHPRARNQLPHFFYATQTPAHLQQQ